MSDSIVFIKSGEMAIGKNSERLVTLLGSCIAVCIFDTQKKIGGLNHYLLPDYPGLKTEINNQSFDYGIYAIPALLRKLKDMGCSRKNLRAKIIGGAEGLEGSANHDASIGAANIAIARRVLSDFGILVVAEDVGGNVWRRIQFNTSTGEIRLKKETHQMQQVNSEQRVVSSITEIESIAKKKENRIKVLIVDDSVAIRMLIRKMIEVDPDIEVIGEAKDPFAAEEIRKRMTPDVLTLDLHMPDKNGVEYLREYMFENPVATIIVSDCNLKDTGPVMDALEAGAFDYVQKPTPSQIHEISEILIAKIKAAAKVDRAKLVPIRRKPSSLKSDGIIKKRDIEGGSHRQLDSLIALGASTGGTEAIKTVLTGLPKEIPTIFIVQHMPPGFTKSFADRLNEICPFLVKEAEEGEIVYNGCVYVAPGGKQMAIANKGSGLVIKITDDPPENRFKPSVDYLFRSFSKITNRQKVAVILTGMGSDGAKELLSLRHQGVHTIAQDESSSVVFGMPKIAIDLGAVCEIRRLDQIAEAMSAAVKKNLLKTKI